MENPIRQWILDQFGKILQQNTAKVADIYAAVMRDMYRPLEKRMDGMDVRRVWDNNLDVYRGIFPQFAYGNEKDAKKLWLLRLNHPRSITWPVLTPDRGVRGAEVAIFADQEENYIWAVQLVMTDDTVIYHASNVNVGPSPFDDPLHVFTHVAVNPLFNQKEE